MKQWILVFSWLFASVFNLEAAETKSAERLLKVTFIDVGQGDSELVETPGGKVILIDAGPGRSEWSGWDAGREVVVPYLKQKGIKKIDYMVMSHAHSDHIGGMLEVINNFEVENFVDPALSYPSVIYEELLTAVFEKNINYINLKAGDKPEWDKTCKFEIFNPPNQFFRGGSEPNENSLVLKITYGKVSFLFTGDVERQAEAFMSKNFKERLTSTILKVPHHGSRTSCSVHFLDWTMPVVAVIEVGAGNRFGHPTQEVLDRLANYGCEIYRTDKDGFVEITTDGKTYKISFPKMKSQEEPVNYGEGYEE